MKREETKRWRRKGEAARRDTEGRGKIREG